MGEFRMLIRTILAAFFAAAPLALTGHGVLAQSGRTIKLVVPVAPGGALDYVARLLAEQVQRTHDQTIVVESRPGGGTAIGTEAVARAAPDGDTLMLTAGGNLLISPHVRKVNYDPLTNFEPICALVLVPEIIAVNATAPFGTLGDLLSAARANPSQLTLATLGPATDLQIMFEKLKRAANVNMIYVPYPGVAPAVNALLGGHVTSIITSYSSAAEQFKAGKLRALAVTTKNRIDAIPNVPTVAEAGYLNYGEETWFGLFAPSRTPREMIARFGEWFSVAVQTPEVGQKLAVQGLYPRAICGADFAALVRRDYDDFGRIIREAKIGMQ
jgi:tripartite-type tricarboxylate transporter receptor subunit TctC